jgi:hypothetical protein
VTRQRHRPRRPDLDEKIKAPEVDDPEEALRRILDGQGAKPEDYEPEDVPEEA